MIEVIAIGVCSTITYVIGVIVGARHARNSERDKMRAFFVGATEDIALRSRQIEAELLEAGRHEEIKKLKGAGLL